MAKCFMCGAAISQGILCGNCDKPRKTKAAKPVEAAPAEKKAAPAPQERVHTATVPIVEIDPFPKAPVVPFPLEAATPAVTSIVSLMMVAGVPSILVAPDRSVKYVSDEAKKLFDAMQADLGSLQTIESRIGIRIGPLSTPATAGLRIRNTNVLYSLVPLSGGASGAVLIFRYADASANAPFFTYVRETILGPLRSLRDSLIAASRARGGNDPFLADSAATIDQVLSSLELAPEVGDPSTQTRQMPTVTDLVHRVADRFRTFADLKGIQLQIDVQELDEHFRDSEQLVDALSILMDNALHYVPAGGQVVIGVRWMEHKNKPLLLFFVMDNGPLVPEHLRVPIFEPDFVWNPQSTERTGRSLFKAREFAVAHSGSVWVESKTGKACTFFLRVRPDGVN
ncbi:MAG TPA: HAMP domain-containing sensor histidine kinase [Thermoanaerobaculia bacterium]